MLPTRCVKRSGLLVLVLVVGCATTTPQPEAVRSHVYGLPLDNVLAQTEAVFEHDGWRVKRLGNTLLTNWRSWKNDSAVAFRVYGEAIAAGLCTLRVERVVATPRFTNDFMAHSYDYGGHPDSLCGQGGAYAHCNPLDLPEDFQEDSANTSAVTTATPKDLMVTERERDAVVERELQERIEPPIETSSASRDAATVTEATTAVADIGVAPPAVEFVPSDGRDAGLAGGNSPGRTPGLTALGGIWEGTFTFRGHVTGSYGGEITIAVSHDSAEVGDLCPESGASLMATGAGPVAAWQGDLSCPPIPIKGCSATVIRYNFANATLNGNSLTVIATGNVETPAGCGENSGFFNLAFVAKRAHYLYLVVSRTKERTTCAWPSDWEDFNSAGSMPTPEPPMNDAAYLGIIRAKGRRLNDVEVLLRHCHHRVLLNGQPVLMRVAASGPHQDALR